MGGNMQPQGHLQTLARMLAHGQQPQAACDAPRWRFNQGLEINVEASMNAATVAGLVERGHHVDVINDSYQDFGAGQFIWRLGDPSVEGYRRGQRPPPRRAGRGLLAPRLVPVLAASAGAGCAGARLHLRRRSWRSTSLASPQQMAVMNAVWPTAASSAPCSRWAPTFAGAASRARRRCARPRRPTRRCPRNGSRWR